ncbi:hypothetical protein CL657_01410 [bacterium]|nr:hypothetical protein [bacterium]|tara:strand:- start:833 stop:1537 length:705 start_codon:yes stop_codon:yes gene_type:complete
MKHLIKISLLLLVCIQTINYGVYGPVENTTTKVAIKDSTNSPIIGGSYTVNYDQTKWTFTDKDVANQPTLNITVLESSYTQFTNIATFNVDLNEKDYIKLNYNNDNKFIYVKEDDGKIEIVLDLKLEFVFDESTNISFPGGEQFNNKNQYTMYASTRHTYQMVNQDNMFNTDKLNAHDCNTTISSPAEWEFKIKRNIDDTNYLKSYDNTSKDLSLRWIIVEGQPIFKFCSFNNP